MTQTQYDVSQFDIYVGDNQIVSSVFEIYAIPGGYRVNLGTFQIHILEYSVYLPEGKTKGRIVMRLMDTYTTHQDAM